MQRQGEHLMQSFLFLFQFWNISLKKQNTFRLELNFRRRGGRLSEERPTETPRSWVRRRACGRCHSPVTSEDNRCQNSHVEPSRRGALYFLFGRVSWVRVPVLQRACRPCEVPSDATLLVKRMSIFAANYNCHYFDDEALFYLGRPLGWRPLGPFSSQRLTRHHSRQTKNQDPTVGPSIPVSELHPEVLGSTPVQQERTTGSLG